MPQGLNKGAKLQNGTYCIEEVLGQGTFGITYVATILKGKKKGQQVAIKEFLISGFSSRDKSGTVSTNSDTIPYEQSKAEFIAEAKNLIALNHPNIVKAYEIFEENGTVYYSMAFIKGENLNSYIAKRRLKLEEAVKIITKIAYGLSYMHEAQHMLHLDLKPGNIMRRSSDGQIIIIDFGLSRFFTEDDKPETDTAIGAGTRGYAPIEQAEFKNRGKDFKATIDVYALGATFYKLITSETPPSAELLRRNPSILRKKLLSLGIPEKTISIVEKAMAPNPEQRYGSVMEFIYDINSDERKRRNKGLMISAFVGIGIILAIVLAYKTIQRWGMEEKIKYDSVDDYVFELAKFDQGANHYGEIEHYKFFDNGTGLFLFESWHDDMDCDDPDCELKEEYKTTTFTYEVTDDHHIKFKTGDSCLYFLEYPETETITIDLDNHRIYQGDSEYQPYQLQNEEKTDWQTIKTILSNSTHHE